MPLDRPRFIWRAALFAATVGALPVSVKAETSADRNRKADETIKQASLGVRVFAVITLLGAAFGIINTLVMAVMEQSREIGLRRALGMGRAEIFLLFSLEAVLIGLWGALLGLGLAFMVGADAARYLQQGYLKAFVGSEVVIFTPAAVAGGIGLVCLISFLAGVLPAIQASRLNPIEALRYEEAEGVAASSTDRYGTDCRLNCSCYYRPACLSQSS